MQPEMLFQGAQQMDGIAEELQTALGRLQADVENVVGASWSGNASTVFNQHWSEFLSNAKEIVDDAHVISQLVSYSAELYTYHEAKAAQDLSSVHPGGRVDL